MGVRAVIKTTEMKFKNIKTFGFAPTVFVCLQLAVLILGAVVFFNGCTATPTVQTWHFQGEKMSDRAGCSVYDAVGDFYVLVCPKTEI